MAAKKNVVRAAAKTAENVVNFSAVREAPKPDPAREQVDNELGRVERTGPAGDINAEEPGVDKIYGVASRARWGSDEVHQLNQEAAEIEQGLSDAKE